MPPAVGAGGIFLPVFPFGRMRGARYVKPVTVQAAARLKIVSKSVELCKIM